MYRLSLIFVGIAAIIGLIGLTGYANFVWADFSKVYYVVLLFPVFMLLTVALTKSCKPHSMIAIRAAAFIVMTYALLAFAL